MICCWLNLVETGSDLVCRGKTAWAPETGKCTYCISCFSLLEVRWPWNENVSLCEITAWREHFLLGSTYCALVTVMSLYSHLLVCERGSPIVMNPQRIYDPPQFYRALKLISAHCCDFLSCNFSVLLYSLRSHHACFKAKVKYSVVLFACSLSCREIYEKTDTRVGPV